MRFGLWLLFALALAADERKELFHETVRIPRDQWRAIRVTLTERPATIHCRFTIVDGQPSVRAVFLTSEDTERFRKGQQFRMLAATQTGHEASLDYRISRPGDYMLLIDNRTAGREAVRLALEAWLDFRDGEKFGARELSTSTRRWVAGFGFVWLAVAGGWPGWRIWRAWRRRRDALRGFYPERF